MRHKYLRHKCLRIWGEIAKIKYRRMRAIKLNRKNKCSKIFKIWPNANIYVAKSNVHMSKLPSNLSSDIYIRNFEFIKILSYRYFQTVRILVFNFPQQPFIRD